MIQISETPRHFNPQIQQYSYFQDQLDIMVQKHSKQCSICDQRFKQTEFVKLCLCEHQFCKDCLKYYTMHKIKNEFVLIDCPKDGCNQLINLQSQVFKTLPQVLQQRYRRIINNIKSLSDPSFRICPHCQEAQLSHIEKQDNLFCTKCVRKYCKICLNPEHKKTVKCDTAVIGILKRNYQFKRCLNCNFIVQKNQGCNHMTCICKHQFCYLCGGDWNHGNHQCPPKRVYVRPRSVRLIKRQIPQRKVLTMAAINFIFNGQSNQTIKQDQVYAKGFRPLKVVSNQKKLHLPTVLNQPKVRHTSNCSTNQSFVINNFSLLLQKQN